MRHIHLCLSSRMDVLKSFPSIMCTSLNGTVSPFAQRQCFIYLPTFETSLCLLPPNDSILPSKILSAVVSAFRGPLSLRDLLETIMLSLLSTHLFFFHCYLLYSLKAHKTNWPRRHNCFNSRHCNMQIITFCSRTVAQPVSMHWLLKS